MCVHPAADGMPASVIAAMHRQGGQCERMVSMSGGGGGAALGSPAGILALLVIVAIVGLVYFLFNR